MCMEINVIEIEYVNFSPLRRQNRTFFGKRGLLEGILCTKSNGLENVSMTKAAAERTFSADNLIQLLPKRAKPTYLPAGFCAL